MDKINSSRVLIVMAKPPQNTQASSLAHLIREKNEPFILAELNNFLLVFLGKDLFTE